MRHLVLGTAGHIDHGKSALVRALTGIDPDRLQEEKLRGITIDLGFADVTLGETVLSFVDVPGHERFVRHMVAGASGIDAVLLVVAADDGVRPQTREHLAICSLLGLRHGLVALTKIDAIDADLAEVTRLEVGEALQGTFLEGAPVLPVSSRTGEGLDALRAALLGLADSVPPRPASGLARLPVDRSFVLAGFGTVVTGTLVSGRLREGDEVELFPSGTRARVRGLQTHRQKLREVLAGQRVAVNLQGVDRMEAPRGATLSHPGALPVTRRIRARLRLLPGAEEALSRSGLARFHQGTSEAAGRVRVLRSLDDQGGDLEVEISFRADLVLLPGDRFVLRRPSPVDTFGGGEVVDVNPQAGREVAAARDPALARVAREGLAGLALQAWAKEMGLAGPEAEDLAAQGVAAGALVRVGGRLFAGEAWRQAASAVTAALGAFHGAEPLRRGMALEPLRGAAAPGLPQEAWRVLLAELAEAGTVRRDADRVALAEHRVVMSGPDREAAERIESRFRRAGLDPPDVEDVLRGEPGDLTARIVEWLVDEGRLTRIQDGRLFHADALADLRSRLRARAAVSRTIDVATFKELFGVTRRNAIPLLEQLDAERTTRRVGNVREILGT
ncbi:MAG TPA: selenocysteine-specific translation elongation factor [Candidatus Polarisedimenticolaceae bacterium]|nr:selenocysteine-specific translation elongation factor [Candidatus Polarisedimenticolaceae bacterium]